MNIMFFIRLAALVIGIGLTPALGTTTSINVPITVTSAAGDVLTTFTFQNNSGVTMPAGTPIQMGQAFRYGDIMPGNHPVIRDASTHAVLAHQQWDEISTWRENGGNGSWRHAVWIIDSTEFRWRRARPIRSNSSPPAGHILRLPFCLFPRCARASTRTI